MRYGDNPWFGQPLCKFKKRHHPPPTPHHRLRSISHVCKFKERHHPPKTTHGVRTETLGQERAGSPRAPQDLSKKCPQVLVPPTKKISQKNLPEIPEILRSGASIFAQRFREVSSSSRNSWRASTPPPWRFREVVKKAATCESS